MKKYLIMVMFALLLVPSVSHAQIFPRTRTAIRNVVRFGLEVGEASFRGHPAVLTIRSLATGQSPTQTLNMPSGTILRNYVAPRPIIVYPAR